MLSKVLRQESSALDKEIDFYAVKIRQILDDANRLKLKRGAGQIGRKSLTFVISPPRVFDCKNPLCHMDTTTNLSLVKTSSNSFGLLRTRDGIRLNGNPATVRVSTKIAQY